MMVTTTTTTIKKEIVQEETNEKSFNNLKQGDSMFTSQINSNPKFVSMMVDS